MLKYYWFICLAARSTALYNWGTVIVSTRILVYDGECNLIRKNTEGEESSLPCCEIQGWCMRCVNPNFVVRTKKPVDLIIAVRRVRNLASKCLQFSPYAFVHNVLTQHARGRVLIARFGDLTVRGW